MLMGGGGAPFRFDAAANEVTDAGGEKVKLLGAIPAIFEAKRLLLYVFSRRFFVCVGTCFSRVSRSRWRVPLQCETSGRQPPM